MLSSFRTQSHKPLMRLRSEEVVISYINTHSCLDARRGDKGRSAHNINNRPRNYYASVERKPTVIPRRRIRIRISALNGQDLKMNEKRHKRN